MHAATDKPHKNSRPRPSAMRERRLAANLTGSAFARLLGVSVHTVRAVESGKLAFSPRLQSKMQSIKTEDIVRLINQNESAKLKGYKRPPEVIAKVRAANLGKKRTPEMKAAQSIRIRELYRQGRIKMSPEARARANEAISRANKGRVISLERRLAHSLKMKGRKPDPETVERRAAPMRGRRQVADATRRGSTNHRSLVGVLRSPKNQVYAFRNLTEFVRTHEQLFRPEDVVWRECGMHGGSFRCRASKGLGALFAKSAHVRSSWKGWTAVSNTEKQLDRWDDPLKRPQVDNTCRFDM